MSAYVPGLTADRGSASEGKPRRGAIADDGGADPVSSKSYERRIRRGTFVPSSAVAICWSRVKAQGKTGRVGIPGESRPGGAALYGEMQAQDTEEGPAYQGAG